MSQSNIHQYVGLDVSLKETSICVVDESGKVVWRGRTDSTPQAIAEAIKKHARHVVRIGLESGQLSTWLFHGLNERSLPVICIDARHAKAALSLTHNDAHSATHTSSIHRPFWAILLRRNKAIAPCVRQAEPCPHDSNRVRCDAGHVDVCGGGISSQCRAVGE